MSIFIRSRDGIQVSLLEDFLLFRKNSVQGEWSESAIRDAYVSGSDQWLAIEESSRLKAFIIFRLFSQILEVNYLETHQRFKRKGIMEQLLKNLIGRFPLREIWLEVSASNQAALKLYRKWGFVESGRRPAYYSDGSEALLMTRYPWKSV